MIRVGPGTACAWALAAIFTLLPFGGIHAQAAAGDPEIEALRSLYDYGRFTEVAERARARIDRGGLVREDLVELHKLAGLSAFNLDREADAERHFGALLRLDPDFVLDPFAVSPPAIAFFEKVKKGLAPQLELIRQQLRIETERQRRDTEARDARRREEEERRRRLEEMSRRVTVRTVEKRNFLVNFVPFGAGQFQQGRTGMGVALAAVQGAMAVTSIVAYFAYEGLIEDDPVRVVDASGKTIEIPRRGIRPENVPQANVWRLVKYGSAGAFYTAYAYGVVDAVYQHEDEVVTVTTSELPPEQPAPPEPAPENPPADPSTPPAPRRPPQEKVPVGPGVTGSASSFHPIFLPGGLGAGFTLTF